MKSFRFIQFTVFVLITIGIIPKVSAESVETSNKKEVVTIESTRFATPLVEKWANDFMHALKETIDSSKTLDAIEIDEQTEDAILNKYRHSKNR